MLSKFSEQIGINFSDTEQVNDDRHAETNAIYKLQKDCNIGIEQGCLHCTTLNFKDAYQIWEAQTMEKQKLYMRLGSTLRCGVIGYERSGKKTVNPNSVHTA